MLHIKDTIERSLVLTAPRDVVWAKSFGSPSALSSWFPDRIEGEFVLNQTFLMIWGNTRCESLLVEFVQNQVFAFKWHPMSDGIITDLPDNEWTTVRFVLTDHPEGTHVSMIESGFMNIDFERRSRAFTDNTEGWDAELLKLPRGYEA